MSRSVLHVWAGPNCGSHGCKDDKRIAHRTFRSHIHQLLHIHGEDFLPLDQRAVKHGSDWSWASDGHRFYGTMAFLKRFADDKADMRRLLAK